MKFHFTKVDLNQEPTLREKALFVVAMLGVFVLFLNYLWVPQAKRIRTLRIDLRGVNMQAEAVGKLVDATRTQLAKQKGQMPAEPQQEDLTKRILERRVLDPADEINSTIDLLGSRRLVRRLKIKGVDLGDRIEKDAYTIVPMAVRIEGRYAAVQAYLSALERVERPLVVRSFDIKSVQNAPGILDTVVNVNLFIVKR